MTKREAKKHFPMECVNVRCKHKSWCGGCDPNGDYPCSQNPWPCKKEIDGKSR